MNNTFSILLVEDDVVDVMSVRRALRELNSNTTLSVAGNGEEALVYLRNLEHPLPGIILLDLNMPRMNGIDVLKILKNDERLRRIPVVILTTSKEEKDRLESFNLSVAGYMIKPVDYAGFVEIVRTIQRYWNQSEMPP
ncbi:MAG TPA: response regulator [Candidatus Saccharimonadales bacterium]|nr:response regulator [Candidatus Saccharimonadales bacterium]